MTTTEVVKGESRHTSSRLDHFQSQSSRDVKQKTLIYVSQHFIFYLKRREKTRCRQQEAAEMPKIAERILPSCFLQLPVPFFCVFVYFYPQSVRAGPSPADIESGSAPRGSGDRGEVKMMARPGKAGHC